MTCSFMTILADCRCAVQYLLNPEGKFVTFFGKSFEADEIAISVIGHARAWQSKHPEYKMK
jgi:hypothetical protein